MVCKLRCDDLEPGREWMHFVPPAIGPTVGLWDRHSLLSLRLLLMSPVTHRDALRSHLTCLPHRLPHHLQLVACVSVPRRHLLPIPQYPLRRGSQDCRPSCGRSDQRCGRRNVNFEGRGLGWLVCGLFI